MPVDGLVVLGDTPIFYIQNLSNILREYIIYDSSNDKMESTITIRFKYLILPYYEVFFYNNCDSVQIPSYNFNPPKIYFNNHLFRYKRLSSKECVIYKENEIILRKINPFSRVFYADYQYYDLYIKEGEDFIFLLSALLCLDFDFKVSNNW